MTKLLSVEVAVEQAIGYVRVSDAYGRAGKDNFFSPVQQRQEIERFCAARGIELVDAVEAIDQTSKQGQNFETATFQELKDKIGPGMAIVVYRFDRFGRDLGAACRNIEEIEAKGGRVLSVTETNSNDSSGRLARDIFFSFAQYQLNRITESWIAVHEKNYAAGVQHGGPAPFGYDKPKVNGAPQPLVPNADAKHVKWLFEQRAKGVGVSELWRRMMERTGREWTRQSLYKILRNRAYLGEIKCGKRPAVKDAHPALVSRATFEGAQRPKTRTWARKDYLLTGLLYCDTCGHRMQVRAHRDVDFTYGCLSGKHTCGHRASMTASLLETHVEDQFLGHVGDVLFQAANLSPDLIDLERAHAEAEDDVRAWNQNTTAQRGSMELWQEEAERRASVLAATSKALREAMAGSQGDIPDAATIKSEWADMTNERKRRILSASVAGIYIGPGRKGIKGLQADRVRIEWV